MNFLAVGSDGYGNILYQNREMREKIRASRDAEYEDFHCEVFSDNGIRPVDQHKYNKWFYDPFTDSLDVASWGSLFLDDSCMVHAACRSLDWHEVAGLKKVKIAPQNVGGDITDKDVNMMYNWDIVYRGIIDCDLIKTFQRLVGSSIAHRLVGELGYTYIPVPLNKLFSRLYDGIGLPVHMYNKAASSAKLFGIIAMLDIVADLPKAISLRRAHPSGSTPGTSWITRDFIEDTIQLWHRGLVPSFDGGTWRILSGPEAEVVFDSSRQPNKRR